MATVNSHKKGYKIFGGCQYLVNSRILYRGNMKNCYYFYLDVIDCIPKRDSFHHTENTTYTEVESGDEYTIVDGKVVSEEITITNILTYEEFANLLNRDIDTSMYKYSLVKGKIHGEYKEWHPNGLLYKQCIFENGDLQGLYSEWHPNGQLHIQKNYSNGKLHGEYKEYLLYGENVKTCIYKNNNLEGICKTQDFYMHYVSGYLHGTCILIDRNDDKKAKKIYYYYKGKLLNKRDVNRIKSADPEYCILLEKLNIDYGIDISKGKFNTCCIM